MYIRTYICTYIAYVTTQLHASSIIASYIAVIMYVPKLTLSTLKIHMYHTSRHADKYVLPVYQYDVIIVSS